MAIGPLTINDKYRPGQIIKLWDNTAYFRVVQIVIKAGRWPVYELQTLKCKTRVATSTNGMDGTTSEIEGTTVPTPGRTVVPTIAGQIGLDVHTTHEATVAVNKLEALLVLGIEQ